MFNEHLSLNPNYSSVSIANFLQELLKNENQLLVIK